MEDDFQWKTTFRGRRQPLVEDDLWWKTIFGGRQPLGADNLPWKTTFAGTTIFSGRRPSVEDDLLWKTTVVGRRPIVEDYLRWKKTFSGRRPSLDPCMLRDQFSDVFLRHLSELPKNYTLDSESCDQCQYVSFASDFYICICSY